MTTFNDLPAELQERIFSIVEEMYFQEHKEKFQAISVCIVLKFPVVHPIQMGKWYVHPWDYMDFFSAPMSTLEFRKWTDFKLFLKVKGPLGFIDPEIREKLNEFYPKFLSTGGNRYFSLWCRRTGTYPGTPLDQFLDSE